LKANLEFTPQGQWRGISYYLTSGNGCGYCTSEVASTVKLSNGRLIANVTGTEKDRLSDPSHVGRSDGNIKRKELDQR
jgi:hypothetical protein